MTDQTQQDAESPAPAVDAAEALKPVEETVAPPADEAQLLQQVEAVLMSIDRAIAPAKLAETLGLESSKPVNDAVKKLNKFYEESGRSFRIEQVAGGLQILTLPEFKDVIARLHRTKDDNKLSPAALETLAIIAYKQPVLRVDIETIRGVSSGEVIRVLMERHLVKIVGRAEEIGRPMLYGTTKNFLETFGLASLKDLPNAQELAKP
jgi:segregation and condensation protein B